MRLKLILTCVILCLWTIPCFALIGPNNIAVIANTNTRLNGISRRVADYYCDTVGISKSNIIEINVSPAEYIYQSDWAEGDGDDLSGQIRSKLISQFGVNPNDPATDPIQVLVMCYGVPSKIEGSSAALLTQERTSVDSFLTLLFNNGANGPDIGPDLIDGDCDAEALGTQWYHGTQGVPCPYSGKDEDFATFRASTDNDITYLSAKDNLTHHWKMRYLVCRLDAYDDKKVDVTGYGTMPQDVKNIIDRAHNSTGKSGKFILDEPWNFDGRAPCYAAGKAALMSIVDPAKIIRDGNLSQSQTFLNQDGVICYSSFGMHDADIAAQTQWGRTHNNWVDGSLAIIGESSACDSVRYAHHDYGYESITALAGEHKLRVVLEGSGLPVEYFQGYRVALCKYSSVPLDNVNDHSDDLISATASVINGHCIAEIDLHDASIAWPSDHRTRVQVYFPDNDSNYHNGQKLMWSTTNFDIMTGYTGDYIYNQQTQGNGVELKLKPTRQMSAEYIRDGCTAIAGPVTEAANGCVADCNIIFPRYAKGYSWAESAYMGCGRLGYKGLMVGDPLMAPYAEPPTVALTQPSANGTVASGTINIAASATPSGQATGIARMEVRINSGFRSDGLPINELLYTTNNTNSVSLTLDTSVQENGNSKYPDGIYTIQVIAFDNTAQKACGIGTRSILIRNGSSSPVNIGITTPGIDNQQKCGTVSLEATVDDSSTVNVVEFWIYDPKGAVLIGTDASASDNIYSCNLSTEQLTDGTYTIQAVARCTNGITNSAPRSLVITNRPRLSITEPDSDLHIKSNTFSVTATVDPADASMVNGVEFFVVFSGTTPQSLGISTSAPYTCSINPSTYSGGTYTIRAVPRRIDGVFTSNNAVRRVIFTNGYDVKPNIAAARLLPDGSSIALENLVVSAYGSSSLEGAFYVVNPDRSAGIRVVSNSAVNGLSAGDKIGLLGTMHTSSEGERDIIPDSIIRALSQASVKPMYMTIGNLGGRSPDDYTNGIDDAQGLYNIGQLVRICGRVNYICNDFVYVDDGSGVTDDSGMQYKPVPLDGSAISADGVDTAGVRVYFGTTTKPKIGDYVAVEGISSCKLINSEHARYIRATRLADMIVSYQPCYVWTGSQYWPFFANANNTHQYQVGEKVRIATNDIISNSGNYFTAWSPVKNRPGDLVGVDFLATTALTTDYANLIVVGTITGIDPLTDFSIWPDAVYQGIIGESGIGILSLGTPAWSASALSIPTRSENIANILSSESFQRLDSRSNCIGWALPQPDGSVVDLIGEYVTSRSADGSSFGLKEVFEPSNGHPRLVLNLPAGVPQLTPFSTIDIIGGRLATLSNGQRAILYPQAVYVNTTAAGNLQPPIWSKQYDSNDSAIPWQWRNQVYP